MVAHGKRYRNAAEGLNRDDMKTIKEAVALAKKNATAKFDETIELVANLGIDPKKADQMVRGTVSLPHGTGKTVRVAVFAEGDLATQAKDAGADIVGSDDLAKDILGGTMDFDIAIATPDMMRVVGRLGKVLGPRGLMPNPKTGTVTADVATAIEEFKAGKIEYRADKAGTVAVPVGKASFSEADLLDNVKLLLSTLQRVKPSAAKGTYFKSVFLSSTMGPSVKIDTNEMRDLSRAAA